MCCAAWASRISSKNADAIKELTEKGMAPG